MPFFSCYYHVVWSTKERQPLLTSSILKVVCTKIVEKSDPLKSKVYAINGYLDHLHIATTIPPSLAVADWVQQVKGLSTYIVNRDFPQQDEIFRWQSGYSVHTFGQKDLSFVMAYIKNQATHHQNQTLYAYLEQLDDNNMS